MVSILSLIVVWSLNTFTQYRDTYHIAEHGFISNTMQISLYKLDKYYLCKPKWCTAMQYDSFNDWLFYKNLVS